ncbi:DNA-directed RNA polymerase subunit delta [Sporosarcina sp. ACRSL]|nr:DNA-directed RNA polymerase subunit delta [Sporosarcina sp. ACRSL]MCG7343883.1 DNA-directed RNA polymerase subunit delta [Sporosarcina sp. ACRSL]
MNLHELTKEELLEESMIDIAYAILTERREALTLEQLMNEIRELTGMSESQMKDRLLQFYTDMNIDGRFLAINNNQWGLREWYPVEQIEEETAPVVKVRKKKKKKAYDDDEEEEEDEEEIDEDELLFDEEFDELDDDEDELDEEEDEEEIIEIEEDLIDDDEGLEIVPDDELDIDDVDEEDEEDEEEEDLL